MSTIKVQNTHIRELLPQLHRALIDIVGVMNEPERDAEMLRAAGLSLERALFPLLVSIERLGPVGVVEIAGRVGRDYTTVSRQVARLEELGLVKRRASAADKRVKEAQITPRGKVATDAIDAAREKMAEQLFRDWAQQDFEELVRLVCMLADGMSR
ncbi:DNA-binding MarR family transcriptional regulator [Novosphingobium sp. PhB165]|nr:DNA-binding MarR family transcriptional regulator [Novosphingobium sp. PhB165]